MKRYIVLSLVVVLLVQLLTFPVFAAADSEPGFVWQAIDAIGGFFRNLGDLIKDWLIKAMEFLLDGLKTLFIPHSDYFKRAGDAMNKAFAAKFGAVTNMAKYLKDHFSNLRAYRGELLVIKFPSDHLFAGVRLDLLSPGSAIADMIRAAFSGFVVLCTALFVHKKAVAMINT